MGPKQWLAARWLSKSTCEGDVPPLDLPKSNYGLCTEQVTKATDPLTGNKSLRGAGIFTCTLKQISEIPLLYLFILVNLRIIT